jgi:hypothetical protein
MYYSGKLLELYVGWRFGEVERVDGLLRWYLTAV